MEQLCTTSVKMKAYARTNNQPNMIIQLNKQASGFFTVPMLNLNKHNFPKIRGSFDTCMNSIGQQVPPTDQRRHHYEYFVQLTDTGGGIAIACTSKSTRVRLTYEFISC